MAMYFVNAGLHDEEAYFTSDYTDIVRRVRAGELYTARVVDCETGDWQAVGPDGLRPIIEEAVDSPAALALMERIRARGPWARVADDIEAYGITSRRVGDGLIHAADDIWQLLEQDRIHGPGAFTATRFAPLHRVISYMCHMAAQPWLDAGVDIDKEVL